MQINMRTFLLSGQIGSIAVGMSRQNVEDILGTPDHWGPGKNQAKAVIWKYGSLEFYFPKPGDSLSMIFTDNLNPLEGGSKLILDLWILSDQLSLEEAKLQFAYEQIFYQQIAQPEIEAIDLLLSSGVELRFYSRDEDKKYVLTSLSKR